MTARIILLLIVGAVVTADVATKFWALTLPEGGVSLLPFADLRPGFNTGISFGLFAAEDVQGYVILVVVALLLAVFFLGLAWRATRWLARAGYGAVIGGALANMLDRLADGAVTDFIDLHAGGWHFPTFNLADVAITTGATILLLSGLAWPSRHTDGERRSIGKRS